MDKEAIEKIAKALYEQEFSAGYWDIRMSKGDKAKWLARAAQILPELRLLGWKGPQDLIDEGYFKAVPFKKPLGGKE